MKQKGRACVLAATILLCMVAGTIESNGAVVPYDQLTPQQKDAFAERVQRVGLSVDQSIRLLETNYQFRAELPAYARCSSCGGTGAARYETSKVKKLALCPNCNGGGRIQQKVNSPYTYNDPKVQTLGSVQSTVKYESVDCPHCGGTGRINVYACEKCGGNGYVAAGRGVYVVGPSSTPAQKAAAGKVFDVLRLVNGKELHKAQVAKLTEEDVVLRHSAGMGKYGRHEFTEADAAKLFGGPQTTDVPALPRGSPIELTQVSSAKEIGMYAVNQNAPELLLLLMSMGVSLDYGNSPFLVLMIDKGDTNAIADLLSKGASIAARDARGRSALQAAVERSDMSLVSDLMARNADPNAKDNKSVTPLHMAAAKDNVDLVAYLIDHGARVDSADADGRTPYDYAKASPDGKKVAEKMEIQNADYAQAKALVAENKFDEAMSIYGKYKDPGAIQSALITKGAWFEGRGQYQEALQIFKQANAADEIQRVTGLLSGQQDKLAEARNLEKAARPDEALAAYAQAGAKDEVVRLALQLAKDMEAAKQYEKAAKYFESAGDWDSAGKMRKLGAEYAQTLVASNLERQAFVDERKSEAAIIFARSGGQDGFNPLMRAVVDGKYDDVKYLVDKGADINVRGPGGATPLMVAVDGGDLDIVKLLVAGGADINATTLESGRTALIVAAEYGRKEIVEFLLHKGADINARTTDGMTPMILSVIGDHLDTAKCLADNGAVVNAQIKDSNSLLIWASDRGRLDTVKFLVDGGADVNEKGSRGSTPLISAIINGHLDTIRFLVGQGADVNTKTEDDLTPLGAATFQGNLEVVGFLINSGANVNAELLEGVTLLMTAAEEGHLDVAKLLVANGANVNAKTTNEKTALGIAASKGNEEFVKLLVAKGADVNTPGPDGITPLMLAVNAGDLDIVKLLLDNGADVAAENFYGWTPMAIASKKGFKSIVRYLSQHGAK